MPNNDENDQKKINVVDRRRFDAAGEERGESPHNEGAAAGGDNGFTIEGDPNGKEEVAFGSFVMSLATQVLVQLGEMPAPHGMEIPVDLGAARQTIDIIAMLQKRTRGNLSAEEGRFLEEVLHSLRTSYVSRASKK